MTAQMPTKVCPACNNTILLAAEICPHCGVRQMAIPQYAPTFKPSKDKIVAGIFGLLLGGLGIHHFYLGNAGRGILYLLFVWTFIPSVVGAIEGIMYLVKSDAEWLAMYPPVTG